MERFRFVMFIIIVSIPVLAACNRNGRDPASSGRIAISGSILNKLRDVGSIPKDRTACLGVNVTGGGITAISGSSCSPPTGDFGGYSTGQDISVVVPSNQTVNVDVYLYLLPIGSTASCPTVALNVSAFPAAQLKDTYLIGSATNVSTAGTAPYVDVPVQFPAGNQNITQQLPNLPATCVVSSDPTTLPPSTFTMSAGGAVTLGTPSGTVYKLKARVGNPTSGQLSSTGYLLNVR